VERLVVADPAVAVPDVPAVVLSTEVLLQRVTQLRGYARGISEDGSRNRGVEGNRRARPTRCIVLESSRMDHDSRKASVSSEWMTISFNARVDSVRMALNVALCHLLDGREPVAARSTCSRLTAIKRGRCRHRNRSRVQRSVRHLSCEPTKIRSAIHPIHPLIRTPHPSSHSYTTRTHHRAYNLAMVASFSSFSFPLG